MTERAARLSAGLAALAAVLLGLGAAVLPWWTAAGVRVRLLGMSWCGSDGCVDRGLDGFGGARAWPDLALAAAAAAVAAALVLVAAGISTSVGRRSKTIVWGAGVLSLFTAVLGALVIAFRPSLEGLSPGYGMALTFSGAAVGAAVSLFLGKAD